MAFLLDEFDIEQEKITQPNYVGIWWLASYPKSGNTWVRNVVNAAVTGFPPNINAAFQYVCGDHGAQLFQHTAAIPIDKMEQRDFLCYRLAALRNHIAIFGHRDSALKTHNANLNVLDIPLIPSFMSKGGVYIVRDPRDVVISLSKHLGQNIDVAIDFMENENAIIKNDNGVFHHYLSSWSLHVESWLDEECPLKVGCIRYEDLLSSPAPSFRHIFDCLGLEIEDSRIEWAIEQCRIERLREQENKKGFKESSNKIDKFGIYDGKKRSRPNFFGKGRAGGWRNILNKDQIQKIENKHGEIMRELGYLK